MTKIWGQRPHYSLCQKKRTFYSEFFRGPPGGDQKQINADFRSNG